jgi:hypothetical protein
MDTFSMRSEPMLSSACVIMSSESIDIYLLSLRKNHKNPRPGGTCQAARIGKKIYSDSDLAVVACGVAELDRTVFVVPQVSTSAGAGIVPFCGLFLIEPSGRPGPRLTFGASFSMLTITCSIRSRSPRNCANIFSKSIRQSAFCLQARKRFTQRGEVIGRR